MPGPDPPRGFASLSPFSSLMSLHPWAYVSVYAQALLLTLHATPAYVSAPLVPPLSKMSGHAPAKGIVLFETHSFDLVFFK